MIPLRDENPTRSTAFVTIALIVANVAVFFYELTLTTTQQVNTFFADFALVPSEILTDHTLPVYGTVISSMFLHGGWLHLIGNMLYLWIFGNNIEDCVGRIRFILFYLLCGAAAAATQVVMNPGSQVPMVGASGAVSGVLGAYLLLFPRARVLVLLPIFIFYRLFHVPAALLLIFWFALQLLSGLSALGVNVSGGIAFWAHIGGFVAGMLLILPFKKQRVRLFQ
jgi:membrane associated rhomboid family serine protease